MWKTSKVKTMETKMLRKGNTLVTYDQNRKQNRQKTKECLDIFHFCAAKLPPPVHLLIREGGFAPGVKLKVL